MIRRLLYRLRRRSKQPATFEEWRAWQEREFRERLRRYHQEPLP
jgi:hypothetical protein